MHDSLPAEKAYRILEAGPVILVSTRGTDGRTNLMTAGFHMMMQHAPPLVGVIIGPWDYSYQALSDTGECVLAVPPAGMAKAVVDIGNCSGETDDKFARFGLTPVAAQSVRAPLVDKCLANLECRVVDDKSNVSERFLECPATSMPFFRMNDTRLFESLEKASYHNRIRINHRGYIFGGKGLPVCVRHSATITRDCWRWRWTW